MAGHPMHFVHWRIVLTVLSFSWETIVGKPGFLLTTHNTAIPGSKHNVCITFTGVTSNIRVEFEFRRPQDSSFANIYAGGQAEFSAAGGCKDFALPVTLPSGSLELSVKGFSTGEDPNIYDFTGNTTLKVFTRVPDFTLLQTDKPIYKPGHTVRIRLVTLMFNLSVVTTGALNISIKNPDGIDIERWENVLRSKGIVELSLKLADEPRLGTYEIVCNDDGRIERKNFTVSHYVLPRVEVQHKPAEYFVKGAAALNGKVCARYTFSGGVNLPELKGFLTAKFTVVKVGNDSRVTEKVNQTYTLTDEINGCYTYNISAEKLGINWIAAAQYNYSILVSVNVVEHGTGIKTTAHDALVKLDSDSAVIKIIGDDTYKPGLKYRFKVRLAFRDGQSHSDKMISIKINNGASREILNTETTDGDGFADFDATLVSLFQEVIIKATFMDDISGTAATDTKQVTSWYSPTGRYIKIRQPNDGNALKCNDEEEVDFEYTTTGNGEAVSLHFQVIGQSNILLSRTEEKTFVPEETTSQPSVHILAESCAMDTNVSITTRSHRGSNSIVIRTTPEMYPSAKLIMFYIAPDGEVIADWTDIRVKECTRNMVKISFNKAIVRPGKNVTLNIAAATGSFCTYGVIDRSIDLLSNGKLLDLAEVVQTAHDRLPINNNWQSKLWEYMKYNFECQQKMSEGNSNNMFVINVNDSRIAFLMGKTAVATDVNVDTRKCFCSFKTVTFRGMRPQHSPPDWENEAPDGMTYEPSVLIRDYFPETWLWDSVVISPKSGVASIAVNAPHSLTSWRAKAMCVHSDLGFGISPIFSLTTFQRFFMRVRLPYSVVRNESVPIIVKMHNYYTDCFTITIAIEHSTDFQIVEGAATRCICGAHPEILVFRIIPQRIGKLNVTITAREINLDEEANACPATASMSIVVGIRDTVVETLLVEPEGKREEHVQSAYICGKREEAPKKLTLLMALPEGIVADSARGSIDVVGDLLGVTLANIGNLIILPTGCGEQSMITFAPISYAARYLEFTGQLTPNLRNFVATYLQTGYQLQLNKRNSDGSFSYYNDRRPSLWLTAFVVKCFTYAGRYFPIARDNVDSSIQYIRRNQLPDGCFSPNMAGVYTGLAPALSGPSIEKLKIRVTAFVVISLLEAGVSSDDSTVERAISCLDTRSIGDMYGLAMTAYAFSLHNVQSPQRRSAMKELWRSVTSVGSTVFGAAGNIKYWIADPSQGVNAPINIETTAYALLAILKELGQTATALPVVSWLTQLRNSLGGYTSTQDTVVAIQALAAFAEATYSTNINTGVVVNASIFEFSRSFEVTTRNKLVLQSVELSKLYSGNLTFTVSGGGCVVVQAKTIYNVMVEGSQNTYFQTLVEPFFKKAVLSSDNCTQRLIQICTKYTGKQENSSTMAIIDIKMISGWIPDVAALEVLVKNNTIQFQHYEQKNQLLSLHFQQITREYRCLTIEATRMYNVRNAKPGQVSTYEYYAPAHRHETKFTLEECQIDDTVSDEQSTEPECDEEATDCYGLNVDSETCPSCSQPRVLSKLCQYRHVLKARLRAGRTSDDQITIMEDLKTRSSHLRQRLAILSIPKICMCDTLDIADDSTPFIVAYTSEIARSRSIVINLSSKDIYVFPSTSAKEEKIAQALRGCPPPQ